MRIKKSITDRVNKTREKFRTALMNAIMELDAKWQEKAPYTTFTFENKVVLTKVKNGTRLQNFSADFCVINQIETEKTGVIFSFAPTTAKQLSHLPLSTWQV